MKRVPCNKSDILYALSAEVTDEVCLSCCSVFDNHKHFPWLVYEILRVDYLKPCNCKHEVVIPALPAIRVSVCSGTSGPWWLHRIGGFLFCHYGL